MTDTHSHIYGPEFDEDREDAILRAKEAGVERILLPNINEETVLPMLSLCRQYPGYCYPMMGLHPEDVREDWGEVLNRMHERLVVPGHPYIAIGEVGLDFYWDETYREEQMEAFRVQAEWAVEMGLPLVIHSRNAQKELAEVLSAVEGELTGVFHCFGGSLSEAEELLRLFPGFCLGIGGVLTYKKSPLPEVVSRMSLDRLVLETDCPYLAPVPKRGKRNESAYVVFTAQRLAEECGLTVQQVEEQTEENVKHLFPKIFA